MRAPAVQASAPLRIGHAPMRVGDHHAARARRVADVAHPAGEGGHRFVQLRPVPAVGNDQGVVLIGLEQLLAAAFAAEYQQAGVLPCFRWQQQLEQPRHDPAVERADQFHQRRHARALRVQGAHQPGHAARGVGHVVQGAGARQSQGDEVRVAGVVRQHFGHAEGADDGLAVAHGDALDMALRHRRQGLEQHVAGLLRHQRPAGQRADRRVQRQARTGQRVQQIGARDDAGIGMRWIVHQQAIHALLAQARAGLADAGGRRHAHGGGEMRRTHLRHHQFGQFRIAPALRQLALHRQAFLEPRGERRAVRQQLAEYRGRNQEADHVGIGAIAVPRAAGHHRPCAEDVAAAVVGEALLVAGGVEVEGVHLAFQDHHDALGRCAASDDPFTARMEAHVHPRRQPRAAGSVQQVERRLAQVQAGDGVHDRRPRAGWWRFWQRLRRSTTRLSPHLPDFLHMFRTRIGAGCAGHPVEIHA